jgi:hypothetical protein
MAIRCLADTDGQSHRVLLVACWTEFAGSKLLETALDGELTMVFGRLSDYGVPVLVC